MIQFLKVSYCKVKKIGRRVELGIKQEIEVVAAEKNKEIIEIRIRRDKKIKPEEEIKILKVEILKNLGDELE